VALGVGDAMLITRIVGGIADRSARTNCDEGDGMRHLRPWFWIETVSATLTLVIFIATLVSRDWLEQAFQFDPDKRGGSFEWLLVVVSAMVTVAFVVLARFEWRRAKLPQGG
jgi:lysylphosphatidylglycerol synthetase-like protein (DUF2156 family)